jgi:hypothetical protein
MNNWCICWFFKHTLTKCTAQEEKSPVKNLVWQPCAEGFNSGVKGLTSHWIMLFTSESFVLTLSLLRNWGAPSLKMTTSDKVCWLCTHIIRPQWQSVELPGTWQTKFLTTTLSFPPMTVETTGVSSLNSIHPAATTCQNALRHNISTSTISMVPRTNSEENPHSRLTQVQYLPFLRKNHQQESSVIVFTFHQVQSKECCSNGTHFIRRTTVWCCVSMKTLFVHLSIAHSRRTIIQTISHFYEVTTPINIT